MSTSVGLRSVKFFCLLFFFWLNVVSVDALDTLADLSPEYGRPFQILACDQSRCNGITGVEHSGMPSQPVQLNSGNYQTWDIRKVDDRAYGLSIAGYAYTGVKGGLAAGDSVYASISQQDNLEWRFVYRVEHDAYTIHPVGDDHLAWTVTSENVPMPYVILADVNHGFTGQLFRPVAE